MAERRMMTKKVTDDDAFLKLSASAQALYLHLSMAADDDGFCNQVSVCMFRAHASVSDLEALIDSRYVIQFESGVIVIRHWRMANALRKDRYTPTIHTEELAKLALSESGEYNISGDGCQSVAERLPDGCQMVANCLPQDRIDKDRVGKDRTGKDKKPSPAAAVEAVIAGSGLTDQVKDAFRDFTEVRRQMRAPLTEKAAKLLIGKLIKMTDSTEERIAIINQSIENGWKGFYLIKTEKARSGSNKAAEELDDFYKMASDWVKEKEAEGDT